jgi:ABC-type lipoprotein release transport system permease subunit
MRKTTEIFATLGAVLSGVSGVLLAIYIEDAKKFLDDLLSRLFGIPKSMVGYNVVTVVVIVLLGYAVFSVVFFLTSWIVNRFGPQKRPVQAPPMIQLFRHYVLRLV